MRWVLAGVLIGIGGVVDGFVAQNAATVVLGLMIFACALGASDGPVDDHNARAHDALNARDEDRSAA